MGSNFQDPSPFFEIIKSSFYSRFQFSFRLPVASAFHPGTVHSVVPTRLHAGRDSHISRTGSGRETLFDPLFDLGSEDTGFVPMTEEEFYRAKIKMKDG